MSQAGLQLPGSGSRTEKKKWNAAMRNLSPYMLQCMSYSCAEIACSQEIVACIMILPLFLSYSPPCSVLFFSHYLCLFLPPYTQNPHSPKLLQSHIYFQYQCKLILYFCYLLKSLELKLPAKLIMTWYSCCCWHLVSSIVLAYILWVCVMTAAISPQ